MFSHTKTATFSSPIHISWLLWPAALLVGLAVAMGSLSYSPSGRINVLWIVLLWAGLPLLGSVMALWASFFGASRPWLFQWRQHQMHWHPSQQQRLEMLALLQRLWIVVALGMLVGYWVLLLFTDLAFGWSSTLIDSGDLILSIAEIISTPWQWLWPAAVPDAELIANTRYLRIDPVNSANDFVGDWWRFLMAALLCYNLLPRVLVYGVIRLRQRMLKGHELNIRAPLVVQTKSTNTELHNTEAQLSQWQNSTQINWEINLAESNNNAELSLGVAAWRDDEQAMKNLLKKNPERILWRVNASRSPVAELSDLINMTRTNGVTEQGLFAVENSATNAARHLASWRAFARKENVIWINL